MSPSVILFFCLCLKCGYGRNEEYPGQNKEMGAKIDILWKQYYKCLDDNYHIWLHREQIVSSLMVFKGQSVMLPCLLLCRRPRSTDIVTWFMKEIASDKIETEIDYTNKRVLHANGSLHIYQTSEEDDAIYYCKHGGSDGGAVLLEIIDDEEPLSTVSLNTSLVRSVAERLAERPLELYTRWHPWTACSSCNEAGIRHQTGICYVKYLIPHNGSSLHDTTDYANLKVFPEGLPCRSKYLPVEIKEIAEIKSRKSEIVTAPCKVICNVDTAATDSVTADESTAIFHTFQQSFNTISPAREVLFVTQGERVKVSCPGHALTDVTIRWRIGTGGQFIAESTNETAKVMVNAREQIVINYISASEKNIYSCWQSEELVGTVRINMKTSRRHDFDSIVTIASLCMISAVFLLCIGRMARMKLIQRRKIFKKADV